ncbi:MAG TPA: peptide ABC transporter substrate-binding protein [Candidatus Enterocloster excrementipullorum]|uniref:Peptide ABC transporter substrate-binding protein n=1 Tax=Candidatus Enterocloster excrementipullorum TaxID=2838559 RepID=A0A9D2N140_9FIRM|nr:peptide ABC transporter substrate-binding protein [Candidatus Enterocloster excrementipullorum]
MKHLLSKLIIAACASMVTLSACAPPNSGGDTAAETSAAESESSGETSASAAGTDTTDGAVTITMAMTAPWDTFIPFNTTNANTDAVLELMYDKLIVVKANGEHEPRLATKWEQDSETGKILTFELNENAKWHDGEPVTADDVVFTCELMANEAITHPRRSKVAFFTGTDDSGVRVQDEDFGVVALDDHTVQFTMKDPAPISYMLSQTFRDFYVLPEHLLADIPADQIMTDEFWQHPIGSGPCIYESSISGERVEFAANKDYYLGAPQFDRFVVRVVPASNLLSGLMSGEIDITAGAGLGNIPMNDWDLAQQQENLTTESVKSLGYQYLSMNVNNVPKEVRQAVNMAINRDALVNNLMRGEGEPAAGPLRQNHPYFNPDLLPIPYDVETAAQMVKDSGFDTSKTYVLRVSQGNEVREKSAPLIQQDLKNIGISVEILTTDHPTLLAECRNGNYDFALIGSGGSPDPAESVINVRPGHVNNFSQNTDESLYQKGMVEGFQVYTYEERLPIYQEYQMMLRDQVPFSFLYFQNDLVAYNKRISNVHFEDFSLLNRMVWQWNIEK